MGLPLLTRRCVRAREWMSARSARAYVLVQLCRVGNAPHALALRRGKAAAPPAMQCA